MTLLTDEQRSDDNVQIAVVVASTRDVRVADNVTAWFLEQAKSIETITTDVLDLRQFALPQVVSNQHPKTGQYGEPVRAFAERVDAADGFVFITPELNHGYPASLKSALDAVYQEWAAKPATFVSYGGLAGGVRAVEQLRQVLVELHMVPLRDAVALPQAGQLFDQDGTLTATERFAPALHLALNRLAWWSKALRVARSNEPYAA